MIESSGQIVKCKAGIKSKASAIPVKIANSIIKINTFLFI